MKALYVAVGVIIGLIVNLIVLPYIFSEYYDMKKKHKDDKYKKTSPKESIYITKGVCNLVQGKEEIHTYDFNKNMYVDLKPSVNRIGGNQFTYSFWLRRNKLSGLDNKIMFFRGTDLKSETDMKRGNLYHKLKTQLADSLEPEDNGDRLNERFIKCPLVRFVNNGLRVEFNTIKNPHMSVDLDAEIFSILKSSKKNPKYNLITISFQDNFDFGGRERGIKVEAFIDDALVKTSSFENNSLRMNEGKIILFANNIEENDNIDADFAELMYHNYAMNIYDVESLYNKGFNDITCQLPDSWTDNKQRYTMAKVNLYNETQQLD
uniref:Uncharacterized protein n=1 Tax=viral metagenome TaxID=1070528 RepID=A0A6C0CTX5_9ZZZZ